VEELPFDEESFDLVQMRICPNIRQRSGVYQEIHLVLKDGGKMQLLEPANFLPFDSEDDNSVFSKIDATIAKIFTPSQTYSREKWSLDAIDAFTIESARGSSGPMWYDIVQFHIILPVGDWSSNPTEKELGSMMGSYITLLWGGLHDEIIQKGIMSGEEFRDVESDLAAALTSRTRNEVKMMYNCLSAKKRLDM